MSALIGHAKAARILAEVFVIEGDEMMRTSRSYVGEMLFAMARVHFTAADRMEQAMREEATGHQSTTKG